MGLLNGEQVRAKQQADVVNLKLTSMEKQNPAVEWLSILVRMWEVPDADLSSE
jgi:hypothetical protein